MEENRSLWNQHQQELRQALSKTSEAGRAIPLFLDQHAQIHSAVMSNTGLWSFEDEIWAGLDEKTARCIPPKEEHSIVWIFWHLTRIEDMTINVLIDGQNQLFDRQSWPERLQTAFRDTANGLTPAQIAQLSAEVNLDALRAYRLEVGRATRAVISQLSPAAFKQKADPQRLASLLADGSVAASETWLTDYWGGLTLGGLLLMPPTRHNIVHFNEAQRIKTRCRA